MRSWIYHHSGLVVGTAPASFEASHRKGGIVDADPKAREKTLLALAKQWKARAIKAEQKELELRKAVERQAKSILSVIHS